MCDGSFSAFHGKNNININKCLCVTASHDWSQFVKFQFPWDNLSLFLWNVGAIQSGKSVFRKECIRKIFELQ